MTDETNALAAHVRAIAEWEVIDVDAELALREAADALEAQAARIAVLEAALVEIDALDPEHLIDSCAQTAMRGLVLRMGELARAALASGATPPDDVD